MFKERFEIYKTNQHYLNRYLRFISSCIDININLSLNQPILFEKHHILPKYLYPHYKSCGWNIIELTPRQHFIAHVILSKLFIDNEKDGAVVACIRMKTQSNNSKLYEYAKKAQSLYMKKNNPMFNESIRNKATDNMKKFYESEQGIIYRKNKSIGKTGKNNISEQGLKKLSERWKGVSRPKTTTHIENNIKAQARGIWHTPWGDFYSPGQAARNINSYSLSRHKIDKYCKIQVDGFSYTDFNKNYNTSRWKTCK
jgi:hypothetical protein